MVLATDGLFDNLYDDEILEEVQQCLQNNRVTPQDDPSSVASVPQLISDALARRAKEVSEDPANPSSPFQVRAMHEGLYYQASVRFKRGRFRQNLIVSVGWKSRRY